MTPERLWWWSTRAYQCKLTPLARVLKTLNFVLYKAVLPYECDIQPDIMLKHRGMGTVIHPKTVIGNRVRIGHNVTVSAGAHKDDSPCRVYLHDGVTLGAGSMVLARRNQGIHIGEDARVGAGAVVTHDVPPGVRMIGPTATPLNPPEEFRPQIVNE